MTNFFANLINRTLGPLFLMTVCPPTVIYIWHTHAKLGGSVTALYEKFMEHGIYEYTKSIWPIPDATTWNILSFFFLFELILMIVLPGKRYEGPITPKGEIPVYKANGFQAFFVTHVAYIIAYRREYFKAVMITNQLGNIFAACINIALFLCFVLYLKGIFFPSSKDHSHSKNFIFDYYWGTELYPRIKIGRLEIDIKHYINCRIAMMSWSLLVITYCLAQYEIRGNVCEALLVSAGIQVVYVTKFFIWETGYLSTIDIMHDRAGFYIIWGILCWLPCVYTSSAMYLFYNPIRLSPQTAWILFFVGIWAVYVNYESDEQRYTFRMTKGQGTIWGSKVHYITATYITESGEEKTSLLLTDGWWAVSRHFNYFAEWLSCFLWVPPVQFDTFLPYFYFCFMLILLLHREIRDDARCLAKYGKYYEEYKRRVPYRIIPGIY